MNLESGSHPRRDPDLNRETTTRHRALARGQRQLPNLVVRSAFTVFLLYGLLTLFLITVVELGYLDANLALVFGIGFAVLQFSIGPWIMDLSLSWLYSLTWVEPRDLPDHLREFVDRICHQQEMKFPRFGIIADGAPQAFTYGHHPNNARIVISRGTVDLLLPPELEAVVAHEIGHARHWDMALMTLVNLVPLLFFYLYRLLTRWGSKKDEGAPWYVTAGAYVLYIVSEYIVLWFSRTREFYADRFSGAVTRNPNALMTALIKIAYGLAAQESTSTAPAGEKSPSKSGDKKKDDSRELLGSGALAALSIFDRKAAVSMVVASASNFSGDAIAGLDPERVQSAMQWDMWNPWAKWYELHSTHPRVARRLEYLADQAATFGQTPAIVFNRAQPESYWGEFAVDVLLMSAPVIGALGGLAYGYSTASGLAAIAGPAVALCGVGVFIKSLFRYRRGAFKDRTVADLLAEVKVSPVRPVLATLNGTIIGKGVPGLIYSEDFVLRDNTGILFMDYQQPFGLWNLMFGLLKAGQYQNTAVRVTGWFRRAPVPYFEILRIEGKGTGTRNCYSSYASFIFAALMVLGGAWLATLSM